MQHTSESLKIASKKLLNFNQALCPVCDEPLNAAKLPSKYRSKDLTCSASCKKELFRIKDWLRYHRKKEFVFSWPSTLLRIVESYPSVGKIHPGYYESQYD